MFGKLFGKSKQSSVEKFYAPLSGELVTIDKVPDPVFGQKMMGDGVAIIPSEGVLVSPIDGEIVQVFHTKHAIGIKTNSGLEVLLHIGLETVTLNGEGFDVLVTEGQKVKQGDVLVNFDIQFLQSQGKEIITPLVITNSGDKVDGVISISNKAITKGEEIFEICIK